MRAAAILILAALLAACSANLDVNGYRSKGGSVGPIHCKGTCP